MSLILSGVVVLYEWMSVDKAEEAAEEGLARGRKVR